MPRFPSLRTFQSLEPATSEELSTTVNPVNSAAVAPPDTAHVRPETLMQAIVNQTPFPTISPFKTVPVTPLPASLIQTTATPASSMQKEPLTPLPASLAQQATTTPPLTTTRSSKEPAKTRTRLVIHGTRAVTRQKHASALLLGKPMSPRLRSTLVLGSTLLVLLAILLSFNSLSSGHTGLAFLDASLKWAQLSHPDWNHSNLTIPAQQATPTPIPQVAAIPTMGTVSLPLSKSQYVDVARQAASNFGIPQDAFVRQIQLESGFNPNAVSPGGAVGIAQFMPATAAGLGVNPYDPVSALNGAARYMANLANSFGGDYAKGLAAYNAGSGAVQRAINAGGANWLAYMNSTTQSYIHTILG